MNTDSSDDPVLATLSVLEVEDVSAVRAAHLRRRCHAALSPGTMVIDHEQPWSGRTHWLVPTFAGMWCAIYVAETIRRALAFYRAS